MRLGWWPFADLLALAAAGVLLLLFFALHGMGGHFYTTSGITIAFAVAGRIARGVDTSGALAGGAVAFILAAIALVTHRQIKLAAYLLALLLFIFVLTIHLPNYLHAGSLDDKQQSFINMLKLDLIFICYIKKKKMDCLINNLFKQINESKRHVTKKEEIVQHLLLIDEPEVFLHPSFLGKVATLIKKLNEKGVTVILTTHLPAFLSHFIYEGKASLIIAKKNKITEILSNNEILYFDKLRDEIKKDVLSY